MEFVWGLIIVAGAYILGSFPTGYLVVKILKGQDIRQIGSGSTGATNVKRVLGKWGFFGVLIVDAIKGLAAVLLAQYLQTKLNIYPELNLLPIFASIAVMVGHSKSIFLGFTGGKSVATTGGTIIGLNWLVALIAFIIWSSISYFSRYISLGSIIGVASLPILMYIFHAPISYVIYCAIAAIYVIYLHRENVKRLLSGTENKVR